MPYTTADSFAACKKYHDSVCAETPVRSVFAQSSPVWSEERSSCKHAALVLSCPFNKCQCGEQRYAAYRWRINSGFRAFCRMQRTLRRPSVFVTWRRPRLSITVVPCALLITSCRINALVAAGWLAFPAESTNRHRSRCLADETRAQPVPK